MALPDHASHPAFTQARRELPPGKAGQMRREPQLTLGAGRGWLGDQDTRNQPAP